MGGYGTDLCQEVGATFFVAPFSSVKLSLRFAKKNSRPHMYQPVNAKPDKLNS